MIGSILLCDRCGRPGGAHPAIDGTTARKAAWRGTITRVKLGRTIWREGSRGRLESADLCLDCRRDGAVEEIRRQRAAHAERYGVAFTTSTSPS